MPVVIAVAERHYVASLDGLRAVAILVVLLHQGGLQSTVDATRFLGGILNLAMDAGWMGVQLFFVLSGYLITGILLKSKAHSLTTSLKHFYIRRSLRIFPVYYASLILFFTISAALESEPAWLSNSFEHKIWFFLYLNNWITPFVSPIMGHYWSLAVEEQFYILWPLLVLTVNRRTLTVICLALIALAPAFRYLVTGLDPQHAHLAAYVWTPARLDGLLIGALLALYHTPKTPSAKMNLILFVTGAIGLAYIAVVIKTHYLFQSVTNDWTILNQTGCALLFVAIIYYCTSNTPASAGNRVISLIQKGLSVGFLRSIGKHSYAMYIFHAPISNLLQAHTHPFVQRLCEGLTFSGVNLSMLVDYAVLTMLTYAAARISWIVIEMQFLKLKERWPMPAEASVPSGQKPATDRPG